jgi:hypothetical protein
MTQRTTTPISFNAVPYEVEKAVLVRLPDAASKRLPSRGQVAVQGTINGRPFTTVVEPDGQRGHWIKLGPRLRRAAGVTVGKPVTFEVEVSPDWPEPDVPSDLAAALKAAPPKIRDIWADITPMARWEWVRWVNATANPATRERRVEVSISKIDHGKRRPCCFDLSACTDPELAKSGKLRDAD